MAEVLFEIPEWLDYADYDNYPSESKPTTNADFINYSRNQNKLVGALTAAMLWQPNTNFIAGKIIISPNMPEGMEAVALTGGFTGTMEPAWESDIAEYQDSGVKWQLRYQHWSKENATNRLLNTSYAVGNVVYDKSNLSVALKCTQAGTTSNTELDISGRAVGDNVVDGSVVWEIVGRDVVNIIDAQRPIKTYTSLAELGLSDTATEADIFYAMGANAELAFDFYQKSNPNFSLLNTIKKDGFIKFSRTLSRNSILFIPSNEKYFYVGNVWDGNVIWDMVSSESEHQIKTFASLEQLGLDDTATEVDVLNAMPPHSKFAIMFEVGRYKNFVLGRYGSDGFVVFERADYNVRSSICFQPTNERRIITGSYFNNKLIYAVRYPNGNMPFGNKINIEVSNNSTTTYLCPSSGWVYVQVSTNSTYSSLRVQNMTRDYSVMTPNARSNTLISIMLPCGAADTIEIYLEASTVLKAYFFSNLDEWGEYSV